MLAIEKGVNAVMLKKNAQLFYLTFFFNATYPFS